MRDRFQASFFVVMAVIFNVMPGHAATTSRTNLLQYVAPDGQVRTVISTNDWLMRRASILQAMQDVMGPLPGNEKKCPLDVKEVEVVDAGDHTRRLITYASEPGNRVPAYLLVPKGAERGTNRWPALLTLHQTRSTGHQVVVGLGGSGPNDAYGVELVRRGYVCLAPAYPRLANYHPDWVALGYKSGTMKAIWDNIRGIDLLESLPYVQKGGVGAIGHSLGGHNSIYTAVFEPRLRVIVSSCGFDSFRDYMDGNIAGWTSDRYMPALKNYPLDAVPFDFHEVMGALAPRPVFVNAPIGDTNFKWRSVRAVTGTARAIYALHGATTQLHVVHPEAEHAFPPEVREAAYQVIDAALKPRAVSAAGK